MLPSTKPIVAAAGIAAAYLVLYSGYDKATKGFDVRRKLRTIFTFQNPVFSMNEINKAVGLTAMSTTSLAVLAVMFPSRFSNEFSKSASATAYYLAALHAGWSVWHHFGRYSTKPLAMVLGHASIAAVHTLSVSRGSSSWLHVLLPQQLTAVTKYTSALALMASVLVTCHVFAMERNPKSKTVEMRPAGWYGLLGSLVTSAVSLFTAVF